VRGHVYPAEHVQRVLHGRAGRPQRRGREKPGAPAHGPAGARSHLAADQIGVSPQRGRVPPGPGRYRARSVACTIRASAAAAPGLSRSVLASRVPRARGDSLADQATWWSVRLSSSSSQAAWARCRSSVARDQRRRRVSDRARRGVTSRTAITTTMISQIDPERLALAPPAPPRALRCPSLASAPESPDVAPACGAVAAGTGALWVPPGVMICGGSV